MHSSGQPQNVILESNSLLQFVRPNLYLVVLDREESDFKESARLFLDRADALILRRRPTATGEDTAKGTATVSWSGVAPSLLGKRPIFFQQADEPLPEGLIAFIRERFFSSSGISL